MDPLALTAILSGVSAIVIAVLSHLRHSECISRRGFCIFTTSHNDSDNDNKTSKKKNKNNEPGSSQETTLSTPSNQNLPSDPASRVSLSTVPSVTAPNSSNDVFV